MDKNKEKHSKTQKTDKNGSKPGKSKSRFFNFFK